MNESLILAYFFISEFEKQKFSKIKLNSLKFYVNRAIEICYIHKGRYEWVVEGKSYILFPGDVFVTCPWETTEVNLVS